MNRYWRIAIAVCAICTGLVEARGEDWPQWRGPQRDGVWRETGIVETLPAKGLRMRWRAKIGQGYAGPAVAEGRVYVFDRLKDPDRERVLCLEEATGEVLWEHAYPCDYSDPKTGEMEYGNGPRATPTVHGERVYTLGTKAHLSCLDAASGEVHWKKDLVAEYGARVPRYGVSAAPLVEGDAVIVIAGGEPEAGVIAFDRTTGEERWKALADRAAYSAPVAIQAGGRRQMIAWTAEHVVSLDPANGALFWKVPYEVSFDDAQIITSPERRGDRLLCLTGWGRGSFMLKLDRERPAAEVEWKTRKEPTTMFSSPVFQDEDLFYAVLISGHLGCIDAASGEEIWRTEKTLSSNVGSAHLTPNGERTWIFDQDGHLILAKLTREGYEELGRCLLVEPTAGYQPQGPVAWAHPAYANRRVFARNDREIVCASLAAGDAVGETWGGTRDIEGEVLRGFAGDSAVEGLAVSPDGKLLAGGYWRGAVALREIASGEARPDPARHRTLVAAVAFSPDGAVLLSAGGNEFFSASNDYDTAGEARLWDVREAKALGLLRGHANKVLAAVFSPDGERIGTGCADGVVRFFETATRKEVAAHDQKGAAVTALAFLPDGSALLSADRAGKIHFRDPVTGEVKEEIAGHEEEILAMAMSLDGTHFATGSADWTVRLWSVATRELVRIFEGHRGGVYCVAFSPDGKRLATGSGDESVKLWSVATGEARATLRGSGSGVTSVAFSPDGKKLYSGARSGVVREWDPGAAED